MKMILTYWSFDLSSAVIFLSAVVCMVLLKAYRHTTTMVITSVLLILCLFSPLHLLSSQYLFSVHMMVHVMLLLGVGPFLTLSLSAAEKKLPRLFIFLKQHPAAGWLSGVGIMWLWHVPVIFNAAMSSMHDGGLDFIAVAENVSLLVSGILFSAPIIHRNKGYRIDALAGVVYLFTACIACSLLGLLITFAPAGTYHHFLSMQDEYGLNNLIVQHWGITQSIDQQAAGLIMWVPCCLIYVTAAMYLLVSWFKQKEQAVA